VETSVIKTKLNIPPARPQLVSRPRLTEQLEKSLSYSFTLVSAPAGFGKTTLLSEWARNKQSKTHIGWVSLENDDNDPTRFWDYFIAALKTMQSDLGENASAWLHSTQPPPSKSLLTVLINELDAVPFEFVLVLDDYHFIKSQVIHADVGYLLDHMPQKIHLIIASRIDPPLPLVHFRGKGMMLELGADDLRFTTEETAALFREMKGPRLKAEDVVALNARVEGWAVGLKMAVLTMHRQTDAGRFLVSFTGSQRYIMDYLLEEVLQQQTDEVQDFLLKTSVLERFNASLCNAVTGHKDSQDMILKLEHDNLFIVSLDESRLWYRYEHLFADLLRHQLEVKFGMETVTALHRLASDWCEKCKLPEEAINHTLAARDWETAARLIKECSWDRLRRGEYVTLSNWLKMMPEDNLRADRSIYLLYAWVLVLTGQYDAVLNPLKFLKEVAPDDNRIQGNIAAIQTLAALARGDTALTLEFARKALALLTQDDFFIRGTVCLLLGMNYINRFLYTEAEPLLTEAYNSFRRFGAVSNSILALTFLAIIAMVHGKFRQAAGMYQEAINIDEKSPSTAYAHVLLCFVLYEWNDLEAVVPHLERAIALARLSGNTDVQHFAYLHLARTRLAQADIEKATEAIEKADRVFTEIGISPFLQARHAAYHVMFAVARGDSEATSQWIDRLSEYEAFLSPDGPVIAVRALFARKGKAALVEKWREDDDKFSQAGLNGYLIAVRLMQALDALTPADGLKHLSDALTMAKPQGFIRCFVDEGLALMPLLRQAITHNIEPEYAAKLLAIMEAEEARRKLIKEKTTRSPVHKILSEREIEVLKLLVAGFSNQQIADKLIISLSTAKTHVHNITQKLEAENRTQAIARARELKLI